MCQEQNSIMNFAITFLKMLALYMLWRAQFFIGILCRLLRTRGCPKKSEYSFDFWLEGVPKSQNTHFTFGYNSWWKNPNFLTSKLFKVTKSAISLQRKLGYFETYAHKILVDHQQHFLEDRCKDARAGVVNIRGGRGGWGAYWKIPPFF